MINSKLYLGETKIHQDSKNVEMKIVTHKNETFFEIDHYDNMNPFLMTIVSDVDFWMYVSSSGGITAGRKNAENALFPYDTDDKIHDNSETSGAHTALIIAANDKEFLWMPFSKQHYGVYQISRNLYKNALGNKVMFEEVNHNLNMTFRYTWMTSAKYGIIKESEVINLNQETKTVTVMDGIRNILPYGVNTLLQSTKSTLVDGYKRCELIQECGLGIFTLTSIISDKAEPSEALKATTVWSIGLNQPQYLLSEIQTHQFYRGKALHTENEVKGRRGAFYVSDKFDLKGKENKQWVIVSELSQSASKVEELMEQLKNPVNMIKDLHEDVSKGDEKLRELVYQADGLQMTSNERVGFRHFSNTLYNIMRGGIYADSYRIDREDLKEFIYKWNRETHNTQLKTLNAFDKNINLVSLLAEAEKSGDSNFERIVLEYLPLTYSRRHGDPSRPWNKFNIEVLKANGENNLNFEGNWRDIFQNWEALSVSYPAYIESIISKFLNASTADGYNPYRITKDGIDWETLDPKDPWSNIGYWGDHQIIYLLKLMELSKKYNPDKLVGLANKDIFSYSNVPYRLKGFANLVKDPRNTIDFDDACEELVQKRVSELGSDGKLMFVDGDVYHVNLMEKLLVTVLSKITNYVPGGGIWMNTQRPEWNDANNALVGNGVSMVTLYYLYRFLQFMSDVLDELQGEVGISKEVQMMYIATTEVLKESMALLGTAISDKDRYQMVSKLGRIGEHYRHDIYQNGFSGERVDISIKELKAFTALCSAHLKDTITQNKRSDGLYNAYNLITFKNRTCSLSSLYEMLEGQVAVLSSKALDTKETISVLKALRASAIYREDQNSYMLYPEHELPQFLGKNIIPEAVVMGANVLKTEVLKGLTRFLEKDINDKYHFNGQFRNGDEILEAILLTEEYTFHDAAIVKEIFSELFNHHSFTGRSGTLYKYEGLGCIYWHMVSKLVLAVQDCYNEEVERNGTSEDALILAQYYHQLKDGIGADKSPTEYGAFPTDAYSHTPGFAGVQQPGMTGQVKEDFISRLGELGVKVIKGEVAFEPTLLKQSEFLTKPKTWKLPNDVIELEKNQLGFTFNSVPIIYAINHDKSIVVQFKNGDTFKFDNTSKLSKEMSYQLFNRDGVIVKIFVNIDERKLIVS